MKRLQAKLANFQGRYKHYEAFCTSILETTKSYNSFNVIKQLDCSKNFMVGQPSRSSDTLFVLGCGPSINRLTVEDWRLIEKSDSCAFNFWLAHDFSPTHYFYYYTEDTFKALLCRKEKLANTNIISRTASLHGVGETTVVSISSVGRAYLAKELVFHSDLRVDLRLLFDLLQATGYFETQKDCSFIPKLYNTLGLVLLWAAKLGYDRIVLAGFDMENSKYFWEDENNWSRYSRLPFDLPMSSSHAKLHTSSKFMSVPTPLFLSFYSDWALENVNISLSQHKCSSILNKILPSFAA